MELFSLEDGNANQVFITQSSNESNFSEKIQKFWINQTIFGGHILM